MNYLLRNFLLCCACVLVSTPVLAQQDIEIDASTEKSDTDQQPEISFDLPLAVETKEGQEFLFDGGVNDGYILTAAHVIGKPNQKARIVFPDGSRFLAETLGVNSGRIDSGMLKITNAEDKSFPYVQLGISETLKLGQWVMAIQVDLCLT